MILEQVSSYLSLANKGEANMSEDIINEAVEEFRNILKNSFTPKPKREFKPSMSSVGRPLCQQQMQKLEAKNTDPDWHFRMKMLIGDMTEVAAVAIMKAAGVPITDVHEKVSYESKYGTINGTTDISIEGHGVYDIKSASKYAFKYKFDAGDGFNKLREDDAFGYVSQGYLYGAGADKKFCGWIVINKETGEWAVLDTPIADNSYKKEALKKVEANMKALKEDAPFKRCFELEEETFRRKGSRTSTKTGNKYLGITCTYCAYKDACWDKITYAPQPMSKAVNPKKFYYVGEIHD